MKRRTFLKKSSLFAVAVSTFGFVRYDGENYIGDCETTSDILGPFYRPGSPVRSNLVIRGDNGKLIELTGIVRHQDCTTPYKNAKVELWHCDSNGIYDNSTDEYRYRGTTYTNEKGEYTFQTVFPVPYDVGDGTTRPAHFHMMITAEEYQPLVTQLYFSGDENISHDPWASAARNRVLHIEERPNGAAKVYFPVNMAPTLAVEPASLNRLTGLYVHDQDPENTVTFFNSNNKLWMKNEVFGERYEYVGNNMFEYPGNPEGMYHKLKFEILSSGSIKLTVNYTDMEYNERSGVYLKDT